MSHKSLRAAEIARDTVAICEAGEYAGPVGVVSIREALDEAIRGTIGYAPGDRVPKPVPSGRATTFEVSDETTLAAARRLAGNGRVLALNFASARRPGGGFLGGALAQEESLCRSSGLFSCIDGHEMYRHHAEMSGGFYTNYALYSPDVPVFKDDEGNRLASFYACSFITAAAVNAGAISDEERERVPGEMSKRIEKILAIAAHHGHESLVLGAWGCGVFKNDPETIADGFRSALVTRLAGVFRHVVFEIYDRSGSGMIDVFRHRFES